MKKRIQMYIKSVLNRFNNGNNNKPYIAFVIE